MNDGSDLTGTITTNTSSGTQMNVAGSGTAFTTEVAVGDVILTAGGNSYRVKSITSDTALVLTENVTSAESGVAADVRRPPLDFDSAAPHINTNILGVSAAESLGGLDNVTSIAVNVAGTCHVSAPSVTIAGPTARTIAQAAIAEDATGLFTVANHGMRTGTKLLYGRDGTETQLALGGSNIADGDDLYVVRVTDNTFGLNTNETAALAGTKLAVTNDGHDTQTFTGVTATATATVSAAGKVTGYTITNVGSDYQSAPSITVAAPATETIDLTDANKLVVADDEIACSANFYGAIETGDAVTYSKGSGGTAAAGLTDGGVHFIIKSGTANKFSLATSAVNANAGTKIDLTAVAAGGTAHTFIGTTPTASAVLGLGSDDSVDTRQIAHTGWVKKTVGTGGRAGRVHYETLVAASSISGDAEDIATPDS